MTGKHRPLGLQIRMRDSISTLLTPKKSSKRQEEEDGGFVGSVMSEKLNSQHRSLGAGEVLGSQ